MKILIVGCGYLGTKLAERLIENRQEVWGLRRNAEALKPLVARGLKAFPARLIIRRFTAQSLGGSDTVAL